MVCYVLIWVIYNVQMDDGYHHDASITATVVSSNSGVSTRLSSPGVGSNIPTCPLPSGSDSYESGILSQLGISTHLADHMIMAFVLPMRSIRLTLKLVGYIRKRLLLGVGLVINYLEQISFSFLSPDHFGILITSLCLRRYPTTLICSSG